MPRLTRNSSGYAIRAGKNLLLMDCGMGTLHQFLRCGLDYFDIDAVMISHTHPDHVAELIALLFALNYTPGRMRTRVLPILGPPQFKNFLESLYIPFPWIRPKPFFAVVREAPFRPITLESVVVESVPVQHGDTPAIGYRIKEGEKVLAYSGDSGDCPALVELGKDADVLVLDCSVPSSRGELPVHLNTLQAGRTAEKARCKTLVLTHMYAVCDDTDIAGEARREFTSGRILKAEDGMKITV
ncbi:MAG: ribonuclease Z [Armatimonadetes bacterium]|nr:ribonuclease Z [Armatimonadota bacterium]